MTQASGSSSGEVDILWIDVQLRSEEAEKSLRQLEETGEKAGAKAGTATGDELASKLKATDGKVQAAGKQLGDSVTDGMAQGVKSGSGKVEAAADNAAKGIKGKLKSGLSGAFDALDGAGISNSVTDIGSALTGAAGPAALLTVGLTAVASAGAFIASSINVYADLEKELNALKAVSGATADEMGRLKTQALDLGQSTTYSATEVLKVQQELSKAGVSIKDILGGATDGTLLLASATGTELTESLDAATKAMNVFNLTGGDVAHIADVISNGANTSALDVGTFGTALSAVGKVAPQAGLGLEQTTAILSLFADNALEGSDAGTSLKTMLLALLAPSDKAAAQLEAMGVNVYESHQKLNELGVSIKDSDGNLRPFAAIISDLNTRFKGMTEEQRNAAMSTIFGADAVRASSILYDEGSAKLFDYTTKMYESGTAADNAKTRQQGLRGAQEQLGGAMETLQANVGQFFTPAMTAIVEGATKAVTALSDLFSWLNKVSHATAEDTPGIAAANVEFLRTQRAEQVRDLRNQEGLLARADDQASRARIASVIVQIQERIRAMDVQLANNTKIANQFATQEESARQAQPGWQGPKMGPQTLPSGSGIFGATGVGNYRITQELGEHPNNPAYKPFPGKPFAGHEGVDIATPIGTPIEAAFTGMLQTKTSAAYGKYIELVDEKGQKLILAHLSAYAAGLEAQVKAAGGRLLVSAGQEIGLTGNTGNSTGPHLHVGGVTADGRYVDARSIDYAGMAKPTFQSGAPAQPATDWDKLIAKAKELKGIFDEAKPGSKAAIVAQQNIDAFKKSSDAAKSVYSEIERAAGLANKKVKETDEERAQRLYKEKIAQDALTASLRGASDERLKELNAQGVTGQTLEKWEAVRSEIARRETDRNKKVKETDEQREQRLYKEKIAQDALTTSLRGASDARLNTLNAQGIEGQTLEKWEAVRSEIARREQARSAQSKRDAAERQREQAEADRNAQAASQQADQLASKAAGSAAEAARIRSQSLTSSRDQAVRAAGDNLNAVLAVQTAYAPRLVAAADQEAAGVLRARKLANDQWRDNQEDAARETITNQSQLTARLAAIESGWRSENSNAYRIYYAALEKASTDSVVVVEQAGQRVAEAAARQAQAVADARYQLSASLVRYSYGEGESGLTAALKGNGAKDVSDVQAALAELESRAPRTAALIREAYGTEIEQLVSLANLAARQRARGAQEDLEYLASVKDLRDQEFRDATYTVEYFQDRLSDLFDTGQNPEDSGFIKFLQEVIKLGGQAGKVAQGVLNTLTLTEDDQIRGKRPVPNAVAVKPVVSESARQVAVPPSLSEPVNPRAKPLPKLTEVSARGRVADDSAQAQADQDLLDRQKAFKQNLESIDFEKYKTGLKDLNDEQLQQDLALASSNYDLQKYNAILAEIEKRGPLNTTVKVFGADTGIKELELYKSAIQGVADVISKTFEDLVAGTGSGVQDILKNMALMAIGIVKQVAIAVAAYEAQAIALALIKGGTFDFVGAALLLAGAAALAGIMAGLESRLNGASAATSTSTNPSTGISSGTNSSSTDTSKNIVNIPNSAITVVAAPSWVADLGRELDRFGNYINLLVTEGIYVRTDKGSSAASSNSLAWDLNSM